MPANIFENQTTSVFRLADKAGLVCKYAGKEFNKIVSRS